MLLMSLYAMRCPPPCTPLSSTLSTANFRSWPLFVTTSTLSPRLSVPDNCAGSTFIGLIVMQPVIARDAHTTVISRTELFIGTTSGELDHSVLACLRRGQEFIDFSRSQRNDRRPDSSGRTSQLPFSFARPWRRHFLPV